MFSIVPIFFFNYSQHIIFNTKGTILIFKKERIFIIKTSSFDSFFFNFPELQLYNKYSIDCLFCVDFETFHASPQSSIILLRVSQLLSYRREPKFRSNIPSKTYETFLEECDIYRYKIIADRNFITQWKQFV